ncbi:biotin/lipoyl-containing protein [Porphyromonas gingivalis]|uniref:Putative biotin carboxyl carrier protein n=1 Tax=Porphyromonas gingivalis (strain ATCC 33277 / DSM 20709 / CIP 103683 / JCM 12257 / NCTC 11834 / 2561) TaxID=431947 RepID=B2RI27_PORG3|nr:biotin/lipoyl-containing protein [Porphyromonas gingivalis]AIJ35133.1 biofilm PGA synthesis protein PgaD [Porphyromonas gingivalis]ALJ24956.1 biotin carboxyl carrier protein [Porphyromonas gingivalis 381]AUR50499.1 glutaconyl-CoA decarboxylase subunit gamma [Porphyromonas gingivalis ATCC 33277]MDR4976242.1 biotin/lipoyl-containing protein [Porphyromonas gingivalis]SJL19821.1 acetyl-CoA carboxylase biotin carboxyl carrier protein subunit [Porphyromonas gingivalis]
MKEYKYKINGNEYNVVINSIEDGLADIEVNGTPYKVEILAEKKKASKPAIKHPTVTAAPVAAAPVAPAASASASAGGQGTGVKSPLPGVILDVCVKVGDEVKVGQKVAVLEAMKMENNINADRDGKIVAVKVNKGDSILEGSDIVIIG